jgi:REP element-mobilizing transposase RayT
MARKLRIEFEGALYHVITRGNKKQRIFLDKEDKERFLKKLLEYKNRYNFVLYAYALMDNHVHLLIETQKIGLSKIMQGLLQSHTQWHNRKYTTVGHLFQGRYRAILCDKDDYLLLLVRYIHLNPFRAGIKGLKKYPWTSHGLYLKGEKNELVNIEFVLTQFANNKKTAFELYSSFIAEGTGSDRRGGFYTLRDRRILGDEDFFDEVIEKTMEKSESQDKIIQNKLMKEISTKVEEMTGVTENALMSKTRDRKVVETRGLFVRLSKRYTKSKNWEIANFLNRESGSLGYIERQISEKKFKKWVEKLEW